MRALAEKLAFPIPSNFGRNDDTTNRLSRRGKDIYFIIFMERILFFLQREMCNFSQLFSGRTNACRALFDSARCNIFVTKKDEMHGARVSINDPASGNTQLLSIRVTIHK